MNTHYLQIMALVYEEIGDSLRLTANWKGYLKSTTKKGSRYWAKCKYCKREIEGRGSYLIKHKFEECSKKSSWDPDERGDAAVVAAKRKAAADGNGQQPISKFAKPMLPFNQDLANEKFLKALISTSVPMAFASTCGSTLSMSD